jgi:nitroreductase
MELKEAIYTRRSVRKFKDQPVSKETINSLIEDAIQAPSATNSQPWAFVVIQDAELLKKYSDRAKVIMLELMGNNPDANGYKAILANPNFNIFYNATSLVIIYATPAGHLAKGDCCLAAQNLMLSAHDKGLGTCWIGFSMPLLDSAEMKKELGVPENYSAVAPLIIGYPDVVAASSSRKPPQILAWM